jgi:hypothetical protein
MLGFLGQGQAIHLKTNAAGLHAEVYQKDFADAFSFSENQALLASSRHFVGGIYSERKYLIEELQYVTGSLSFPALTGGMGFLVRYFGFSGFNESNVGISYGRPLGKWMDIGIQFNYHFVEVSGYGSAFSINGELGIIIHLSENLHAGLRIYNPGGSKWSGNSNEKLAASFKTGFGYVITSEFYLQLDLIKEEDQQADIQAAIRCQFANKFFGQLGIQANDFSPFGEAGWGWKKMRIYITVSHHPQLGFTPGMSIQFGNFCSKKIVNLDL